MFLSSTLIKFKHFNIRYETIWPLWVFYTNFLMNLRLKKKQSFLKNKKVFKIGFLVSEISKWKYGSLFNLVKNSSNFEPYIIADEPVKSKPFYDDVLFIEEYFRKKGCNVVLGFDPDMKEYIPLNKYGFDIIVYEQPWYLPMIHNPYVTSKYAITVASTYGYNLTSNYSISYKEFFHRFIDCYFTESEQHKTALFDNIRNIRKKAFKSVGCVNLDSYILDKEWKVNQIEKYIIYAPHHTNDRGLVDLSTFSENCLLMLDLAKKYSNYTWVYKPHPLMMESVVQDNIFSKVQYLSYVNEWKKIGIVCDNDSYMEYFKKSVCLITDSCAFLVEYLPTEKPIIHLRNKKTKFAPFADRFLSSYYDVYDFSQIENVFVDVVINQNDYKKTDRKVLTENILKKNMPMANQMMRDILETIRGN